MFEYNGVIIVKNAHAYITKGLDKAINLELVVIKKEYNDEEYLKVLKYIIDYILSTSPTINDKQTISYHSWILQFVKEEGNYMMWEAMANGEGYQQGVDYALKIKLAQDRQCALLGIQPLYPTFAQNIVISKGVYEGLAIDAVRYRSPEHMTGWWLVTDLYDEKIDSLMNVHFFHVAFKRPDILHLLALPYGYRFYIDHEQEEVQFDESTLT